jgi:transposase
MDSHKFRQSSFNQDSKGRWYFNVVVEYLPVKSKGFDSIGIDLGLKDIDIFMQIF